MAATRCAVVDASGAIINIIMADPAVDPPHEPTLKFVAIPDSQAVSTKAWRWSASEGFVDMNPPPPDRSFKKVEPF